MLLYNVTLSVEPEVHAEWLQWMLKEHLRDMLGTGCFLGFRFSELNADGVQGPTYTVQYELADQADLDRYEQEFAPELRQKGLEHFGNKVLAFRTHMRVLAQGSMRDQ